MSLLPFGTSGGWGGSTLWDPFGWDPFFDSSLGNFWGGPSRRQDVSGTTRTQDRGWARGTRVDWRETQNEHIFRVDLPGLGRDKVHVQIEEPRTLRISGEFPRDEGTETEMWHLAERRSAGGSFLRRFRLPDNADVNQVKAEMEHGVLTVRLPKAGGAMTEHRRIDIR